MSLGHWVQVGQGHFGHFCQEITNGSARHFEFRTGRLFNLSPVRFHPDNRPHVVQNEGQSQYVCKRGVCMSLTLLTSLSSNPLLAEEVSQSAFQRSLFGTPSHHVCTLEQGTPGEI